MCSQARLVQGLHRPWELLKVGVPVLWPLMFGLLRCMTFHHYEFSFEISDSWELSLKSLCVFQDSIGIKKILSFMCIHYI